MNRNVFLRCSFLDIVNFQAPLLSFLPCSGLSLGWMVVSRGNLTWASCTARRSSLVIGLEFVGFSQLSHDPYRLPLSLLEETSIRSSSSVRERWLNWLASIFPKLFPSSSNTAILHELISCGQLAGVLHGVTDKAVYIPDIYTHMQSRWVDNFLASNGYLGKVTEHRGKEVLTP